MDINTTTLVITCQTQQTGATSEPTIILEPLLESGRVEWECSSGVGAGGTGTLNQSHVPSQCRTTAAEGGVTIGGAGGGGATPPAP